MRNTLSQDLREKVLEVADFEKGRFEITMSKDNRDYIINGTFSGTVFSVEIYDANDGDDQIIPWREQQVRIEGRSIQGFIKEIR